MAKKPKGKTGSEPLPVLLPVPPPIASFAIKGRRVTKTLITFEAVISHWGMMRSFRTGFFKDGVPTGDLVMKDLGVKLYPTVPGRNEIWLTVRAIDHAVDGTPAEKYEVTIDFNFLGQKLGIDIDWPPLRG